MHRKKENIHEIGDFIWRHITLTTQEKKVTNIRSHKTRQESNIGIIIFTIILLYLIVTIFTYATSKQITPYEVRRGSIVKDNSYTGLILRQESIVYAESDGYIHYFQSENSKIRAGCNLYVLSPQKLDINPDEEETQVLLSEDTQKNLHRKVQNFNENFNVQDFSSVYRLKTESSEVLKDAVNRSKTTQLDAVMAANPSIQVCQSPQDGIFVQTLDGYESFTEEEIRPSDFERDRFQLAHLEDQTKVQTGDPIYKLITSENWSVYVHLDQKAAEELSEIHYIKTRIDKDNETVGADFSIVQIDGTDYGKLDFDHSMIRYAQDRYLNIELILEDETGLKIPKSAVIEKNFYIVPETYVTSDSRNGSQGVLMKKEGDFIYQEADIYSVTEEGNACFRTKDFEKNTVLRNPDSLELYTMKEMQTLKGVYCINKGYAVFRQISILCENDDYYIVKEGIPYGLSNYDHIILDGSMVTEEEVVFQ